MSATGDPVSRNSNAVTDKPGTTATESSTLTTSSASDANDNAQAELATAIEGLLDAVGSKFKAMSGDIMSQMDAMAARLDELEAQAKKAEGNRDSTGS